VLKFGGKVALEVVFDDEDAEEIGVATGAEDVPGKRGDAEGGDCGGLKQAEGVAPAFGEDGPEEDGATGEDDGCGTFGENGET
jgi:hypothetical protein